MKLPCRSSLLLDFCAWLAPLFSSQFVFYRLCDAHNHKIENGWVAGAHIIFRNWMRKNQQILGWIKMNTSFVRMTSFSLHYFSVWNFFLLRIDWTFSCILLCYFAKKMSCLDYFGFRKIQRYITIAGEHRTEKLWKTKRIGDSHMCVRIAGIRSNVN